MTETIKVYCNWCGKEKEGKASMSHNGKLEFIEYDCPDCKKESVIVTWGRAGECP